MIFLFANFAEATLSARLESNATTVSIPAVDAARFPQPSTGERFTAILYDGVQAPEVVWGVSNPETGDIVVERAKENSAAKRWLPGTAFIHTLTTASIEYFVTSGQQEWIDQLIAEDAAIRADLAAETAARVALAATVGSNFGTLNNSILANYAAIQLVGVAVSDQASANSAYQVTLSARVADAEGLIEDNFTAFTTFESAQVAFNTTLNARVGDAEAEIVSIGTAQADFESATTSTLSILSAEIDDAEAAVTAEAGARVTQYDALAAAQSTLTSAIGGVSASLTTTQLAFADLEGNVEARYAIELDADGVFAGFTLIAGTGPAGPSVSEARFNVDTFTMSTPDGLFSPFVFDVVEGVAYLNAVRIDSAYIDSLVVDWADITGVDIDGALIQDATITGAKIGSLEVDTIKIANAAVTNDAWAFTTTPQTLSTSELNCQGKIFTSTGQRLEIYFNFYLNIWHPAGGGIDCTIRLYRDATMIWSLVISATGGDFAFGWQSVVVPDQPAAGSYNYQLTTQLSAGTFTTALATSRFLKVTEYKR